jgi:hypothetical protein
LLFFGQFFFFSTLESVDWLRFYFIERDCQHSAAAAFAKTADPVL